MPKEVGGCDARGGAQSSEERELPAGWHRASARPFPAGPTVGKQAPRWYFVSKQDAPGLRNCRPRCPPAVNPRRQVVRRPGAPAGTRPAGPPRPPGRSAGGGGPAGAGHHVLGGRGGSGGRGRAAGRGRAGSRGRGQRSRGCQSKHQLQIVSESRAAERRAAAAVGARSRSRAQPGAGPQRASGRGAATGPRLRAGPSAPGRRPAAPTPTPAFRSLRLPSSASDTCPPLPPPTPRTCPFRSWATRST